VKRENKLGDKETEVVNVSHEKRKEVIIESEEEEEEKSNQIILCKFVLRSDIGEKVLSIISYIGII